MEQQLIENALALCGKTMEDILETKTVDHGSYGHEPFDIICIEKFCYYLLSEGFIDKYPGDINEYISDIPYAIMHYQSGNEKSLIELLSKIK